METFGFLKEHEAGILGDGTLCTFDGAMTTILDSDLTKVITYLSGGKIVFALTLSLQDSMGNFIAPYQVVTDGEWLWPRYLVYYLAEGKTKGIPVALYARMKAFSFIAPEVSAEIETSAKKYIQNILLVKRK